MTLGEKIERLLEEQKRPQRWLAAGVRVSPNSIFKIIGGGDTSYRIATRIAATLCESTSWLLNDSLGWEDRSGQEDSFDLSGVSDRDLVLALHARVNRIEAMYAKALETLKAMPTNEDGTRSPAQKRVLRDALLRGGYDGRIHLGLLHGLIKLQERIAQTGQETFRLSAIDLIQPEFRDALDQLLRPLKKLGESLSILGLPKPDESMSLLGLPKPKKQKRTPRS